MAFRASFALVTLVTTTGLVLLGCPFSTAGVTETGGNGGGTTSTGSHGGMTTSSSHMSSTSTSTCTPDGPEVCNDGIDNDCNGHIDCDDPSCAAAGYACGPTAGTGWTVVDFSTNATAPCATGYGNAAQGQELPTQGSSMCSCSCDAPSKNPCVTGSFDVRFGWTGCGSQTTTTFDSTGGCDGTSGAIGGNFNGHATFSDDKVETALPGAAQVDCPSHTSLPALTPGASGRWCTPTSTTVGGGCSSGACMPKVDAASWCLMSTDSSMPACPTGFNTHLVLYQQSDIVDTRQCGACSCASNATSCSNPKITVYPDNTCASGGVDINPSSSCLDYPNSNTTDVHAYAWFKYTATPSPGGCSPSTQNITITGDVTGKNPTTICCP